MKARQYVLSTMLLMASCTYNGKMSIASGEGEPINTTRDEKEVWKMADRLIKPSSFAPIINLPSLYCGEKVECNPAKRHVILFWASWCKDCKAETNAIQQFQTEHPEIPWITISLDNEGTKARQYLHTKKIRGTHLFDGRDWRGDACTDYAVPLHGIPYIILVDSVGKIELACGTVKELKERL